MTIAMPPKVRVTIADVARAAGVSPGTVSRVLNSSSPTIRISKATQKQVRETARRLGYRPNMIASALRTQRTGVIGAIIRDINDPFLSLLARELQKVAHAEGEELLFGNAEYDPEIADRQLEFMHNWFDGLIVIGDMLGHQAAISNLDNTDMPSVALANGAAAQWSHPLVSIDDAAGVRLGLDYLCSLGHRRIAFIGNTDYAGIRTRWATFQKIVEERDLYWCEDYLQPCRASRLAAAACAERLLSLPTPPTAIFCMADLLALGALSTIWRLGWRVPGSVSVLGFDDIEESQTAYPPLSTIRQPVRDMAEQSFRLLSRLIDGASIDQEHLPVIIEPKLIIRKSCAPPIS